MDTPSSQAAPRPIRRVVITGSSGAYGRALVVAIGQAYPEAVILGLDISKPLFDAPHEFKIVSVVDEACRQLIADFRPDTIIHLAYVVDPIHDDAAMERVNIGGTHNVFAAARDCRPARMLVASSATAYGAWPDNPVPLEESAPIRGRREFRYAADKAAIEDLIADFAREMPDIAVSWTRPAIFYGPGVSNFLIRFIINAKLMAIADGVDTPLQFVHIDDVAGASLAILAADGRGPYNLSPPDWITPREIAALAGRPSFPMPLFICRLFSFFWWHLRLPWFTFPPSLWYFIRYPWLVTPKRLTEELGYSFTHSARDTLIAMLKAKRKLKVPDAADPDRPASASSVG